MANSAQELTRKDMKGPDRYQVIAGRAAGWIASHQKQIAIGGVVVAVLVVAGTAFALYRSSREEKAGELLYKTVESIRAQVAAAPLPDEEGPVFQSDEERQRAVISSAKEVIAKYPASAASRTAQLAMADAHLRLGENDAAVGAYQAYLAAAPADDSVRFGALEGLAYAQEAKGDLDAAVAAIDRLAKEAPGFEDRAALEKARLLAKQKKVDEAKKILTAFAKDFDTSTLQGQAKTQLEQLGGE